MITGIDTAICTAGIAFLVAGTATSQTSLPAPAPKVATRDVVSRRKSTGSVAGTLQSVWLRRYTMIVSLEPVQAAAANTKPPVPKEKPKLDQKNKMFVPHVLPVLRGTTIRYVNHDDTKHNVYFTQPDGKKLNLGTGMADWFKDHVMDQTGVYVHRCNIHDEMSAYIVVFEHPFFTMLARGRKGKKRSFRIDSVPPGEYRLHVWCEKFFGKKKHKFNRTWNVTVKAGEPTTVAVKP